jgi:hypothetical protein
VLTPSLDIELPPSWKMCRHQRLEQAAVCRYPQMEQFVRDHEVLKAWLLFDQILGEGDNATRRTRTPFPRHALNANDRGLDL